MSERDVQPGPAAEVAALAAGLAAGLRRRERRGTRRRPEAAPGPMAASPGTGTSDGITPDENAKKTTNPAQTGQKTSQTTTNRPNVVDSGAAEIRAQAAACADLGALRSEVAACRACGLCETRTQTVFMDGPEHARVMFVGEAPGADEDRQGVPFVGPAGQLLTDIITKGMALKRSEVVIANILKCRPPSNRDPSNQEKALCTGWLERQIELVAPDVLIPLGRHASGHLLGTDASMGSMRGRVHEIGGRRVVPTYHPAYLLRSPHMKRECWKDIQLAMAELARGAPGAQGP
ncbi:MAG TPA: uracil-DNA glycosylase [Planctomycetota bacterium]|nr:uracil-DNA glycosylase [Planctomycetota bacterium]